MRKLKLHWVHYQKQKCGVLNEHPVLIIEQHVPDNLTKTVFVLDTIPAIEMILTFRKKIKIEERKPKIWWECVLWNENQPTHFGISAAQLSQWRIPHRHSVFDKLMTFDTYFLMSSHKLWIIKELPCAFPPVSLRPSVYITALWSPGINHHVDDESQTCSGIN